MNPRAEAGSARWRRPCRCLWFCCTSTAPAVRGPSRWTFPFEIIDGIGTPQLQPQKFVNWVLCSAPLCKVVSSLGTVFGGTWSRFDPCLPFHGHAADTRDAVTLFCFRQFVVCLWLAPRAPGALPVCIEQQPELITVVTT